MKKINLYTFILLQLSMLNLYAQDAQVVQQSIIVHKNHHFNANQMVNFMYDSFSLKADTCSLTHDIDLQFYILSENKIAAMPGNLVNVTGKMAGAYRLLPNGEHFSTPAVITIPFDEFLLPRGYKPSDIYTLYYDEDIAQWKRLERVSVDTVLHTVSSYTTHFTDFANAVIKVPEMPEAKAFVPTAMTDLPEVNPLQGIPMVATPQANNRGTAELTYPIELPKGRNGLQPNVNLQYSSSSGNGLLGVGWNIPISAISIDTRWGVPRYSDVYETEAYLFNGEQLVRHNEHGEAEPLPSQIKNGRFAYRRYGQEEYYARDTRNQDRVVRYGQNLSSFYWVVTDRSGTRYYYGYDPFARQINENAVVRTSNRRAIGYWALTAIVDLNGNYVRYTYTKENNTIYPHEISYTGNLYVLNRRARKILPPYKITFNYSARPDPSSTGRLGVLQKQQKRLRSIHTSYGNQMLNLYCLDYDACNAATLFKSRLRSVTKYDDFNCSDCSLVEPQFHVEADIDTHVIHAYLERNAQTDSVIEVDEYIAAQEPEQFPGSRTFFRYEDAVSEMFNLVDTFPLSLSDLGRSEQQGWNVGGTFTAGFGGNAAMTSMSVGGNYTHNRSSGGVKSMLLDIDGDGLVDYVFVTDEGVKYRKQVSDGLFQGPRSIVGLSDISDLSREVTKTHSFGVQADAVANISYNPNIDYTYTDIYFTDINGDGLPDLVTPKGVRENQLYQGEPTFSSIEPNSSIVPVGNSQCGYISHDGDVDPRLECTSSWQLYTVLPIAQCMHVLSNGIEDEPINHHDLEMPEMDDFLVSADVYRDVPTEYIHQWRNAEEFEDEDEFKIDEDSILVEPSMHSYTFDSIPDEWRGNDYRLEIINDSLYVYNLQTICDSTAEYPQVDVVRVWVAADDGVAHLNSVISLLPDSSISKQSSRKWDGVRYFIQHNDTLLVSGILDDTNTFDSLYYAIDMRRSDVLMFRLSAINDRKFDNTEWVQDIVQNGVHYNSARDYVCTGKKDFHAPVDGIVQVGYDVDYGGEDNVNVNIYKNGSSISNSTTLTINSNDVISFEASYSPTELEPQWSNVHIHPYVYFMAPQGVSDTIAANYYPDVHIACSSIFPSDTVPLCRLFGPLHKGWGCFGYNDSGRDSIIYLSQLRNTEDVMSQSLNSNQLSTSVSALNLGNDSISLDSLNSFLDDYATFNPLENGEKWVMMIPDCRTETWVVYGSLGVIGQRLHSTAITFDTTSVVMESADVEYDSFIPLFHHPASPVRTIRKKSSTVQHAVSYGAGFSGVSLNQNTSYGSYTVESDYMDLNGDGFPDYIGPSSVQFSTPWGGMESSITPVSRPLCYGKTESSGKGFSAGKNIGEKITSGNPKKYNIYNGSMGAGANGSVSMSNNHISFLDVNADGLPDIVDTQAHQVCYNIGYSFTDWCSLDNNFAINQGKGISGSLSLSASHSGMLLSAKEAIRSCDELKNLLEKGKWSDFSLVQYSISGGLSSSVSTNLQLKQMLDVNGDGLMDMVYQSGHVRLNNNGNLGALSSVGLPELSSSETANFGVNLGVTAGFSLAIIPVKFCFGVQSTPFTKSITQQHSGFYDINGDGYVDYVWNEGGNTYVRYNQNGKRPVNHLIEVENPTGQIIQINYYQEPTSVNQRGRMWNMQMVIDSIDATDMTANISVTHEYATPYHDNYEKQDYGYQSVTSIENGLKKTVEQYDNSSLISSGERLESWLYDAITDIPYRHYKRGLKYVDGQGNPVNPCQDTIAVYVAEDGYWTDYFDENNNVISIRHNLYYDRWHNLTKYYYYGDENTSTDDWIQEITYVNPSLQQWKHNLISLPDTEIVRTPSDVILRLTTCQYNSLGKPIQVMQHDKSSGEAITNIQYDPWGNIYTMVLPSNSLDPNQGERLWYKYIYDQSTQTYPISIENTFGEKQLYSYDLRWGKPTLSVDPAGYGIEYLYDYHGRLTDVIAPKEQIVNGPFTIHYSYWLNNHDLFAPANPLSPDISILQLGLADGILSAECSIFDQRGKPIQKKTLSEVHGLPYWTVDASRRFDSFYRPISVSAPFVSTGDLHSRADTIGHYETMFDYDVLDQVTQQVNPDSTRKSYQYRIAGDANGQLCLATYATDENGISTRVLKSTEGLTMQTIMHDGSSTQYTYSPLGEVKQVIDADGYSTLYEYDQLGRCISRQHPDAGTTNYTYAPNGCLLGKYTSNLRACNLSEIQYQYVFNRLTAINYPLHPENNVNYYYDNGGRVAKRTDGTGEEQYWYDELGNVAETLREIIVPTEKYPYYFRTRFRYDSFGKMRELTYPDGEVVTYNYVTGGLLGSVKGEKVSLPEHHDYILSRKYDESGRKVEQVYGNNVTTKYAYSPARQWLSSLSTYALLIGDSIQSITYSYDGAGNIIQISQLAGTTFNNLGGTYQNDYVYDDQYRLIKAIGTGSYPLSFNASYSLTGLLKQKSTTWSGYSTDLQYEYNCHKPPSHQICRTTDGLGAGISYCWDDNGNLTTIADCEFGTRMHDWDEENRLRFVLGERYAGYYGYDAEGERVYKLTGVSSIDGMNGSGRSAYAVLDDLTLYPNPYMVVTRMGYTKHYYAGSERIGTVFGGGGLADMEPTIGTDMISSDDRVVGFWSSYDQFFPFNGDAYKSDRPKEDIQSCCEATSLEKVQVESYHHEDLYDMLHANQYVVAHEDEVYFTHTDHLGSACWITNKKGEPIQYMHYAPYGELMANQQAQGYSYDERFKFTGKERDGESGYDYYGARYYTHLLGIWLSVDPLADKYPHVTPYFFCNGNPVMLVDPDGRYFTFSGDRDFVNRMCDAISYLKNISPEMNQMVCSLENNPNVNFNISCSTDAFNSGVINADEMLGLTTGVLGGDIFQVFIPSNVAGENAPKDYYIGNDIVSVNAIIAHEFGHCEDASNGKGISGDTYRQALGTGPEAEAARNKCINNEKNAITYENQVREKENSELRSYDYFY